METTADTNNTPSGKAACTRLLVAIGGLVLLATSLTANRDTDTARTDCYIPKFAAEDSKYYEKDYCANFLAAEAQRKTERAERRSVAATKAPAAAQTVPEQDIEALYAVTILNEAGRADLAPNGIRAMKSAISRICGIASAADYNLQFQSALLSDSVVAGLPAGDAGMLAGATIAAGCPEEATRLGLF